MMRIISYMAHFIATLPSSIRAEEVLRSLDNYNKSLAIYEKHLPSDHPDLGKIQNNIGIVHRYLGHYDLALEHYHRALQIQLKSLPAYHPDIAILTKI